MSYENHNSPAIKYSLEPGYIYLPDKAALIACSVGSCVVVSIYDKKNRIGGLAHYLYPLTKDKKKYTPRYGNISIITLIKMFLARGSKKRDLEAQIYGGADRPGLLSKNIGKKNIELARKALKKFGIHIASEDVGGEKPRKIVFNTVTNEVAILKINKVPSFQWYPYKNLYQK